MKYADQQRAAFKEVYANRRRKRLIEIAFLFILMVPLPFIKDGATYFGLSGAVLGPTSFVAIIVVAWVILNGRNWRCAACDNYLGRAFNPKHCRRCGIELRG